MKATPTTPQEEEKVAAAPGSTVIVGYATYWDKSMPQPELLTHICYSFAHIKDDFETLDIKTSSRLSQIVALKKPSSARPTAALTRSAL